MLSSSSPFRYINIVTIIAVLSTFFRANQSANNVFFFRSAKTAESSSNTSSSEDLDSLLGANRAFSGVVIDPVPSGVRKSSTFDDQDAEENPSNGSSDNTDSEEQPPQPPSPQEIHQV